MRSAHRMTRWMIAAAALSTALIGARTASASPEYPTELADRLGMDCPPPCTICHEDLRGGFGTIVPGSFGDAMFDAGLLPDNPATIGPALAVLEGKGGTGGSSGSGGSAGSSGSGGGGAGGGSGDAGSSEGGIDDGGADDAESEASSSGGTGGSDGGGASGGTGGSSGAGGGVVDSDGDGMGDVEELRQNRDPNAADKSINCGPQYGCGARVEPRGDIDGYALIAALAAALGLLWLGRRAR